jgi:hypothetical protein
VVAELRKLPQQPGRTVHTWGSTEVLPAATVPSAEALDRLNASIGDAPFHVELGKVFPDCEGKPPKALSTSWSAGIDSTP